MQQWLWGGDLKQSFSPFWKSKNDLSAKILGLRVVDSFELMHFCRNSQRNERVPRQCSDHSRRA